MTQTLFDRLLPGAEAQDGDADSLDDLLARYGFDRQQHEQIRGDMRSGRIGLAQNRLPVSSQIEDVPADSIYDFERGDRRQLDRWRELGMQALAEGAVAMVSMAGGAGSRWTHGSGAVKALNPFSKLGRQTPLFCRDACGQESADGAPMRYAARTCADHQLSDP